MNYKKLGSSDLNVSEICLGTMTFGEQNSESDAHQQLNYALANGVNFIDTAEMYPVPPNATTYGRTEEFIGSWIQKRGKRDDFILASKMAGPERGGDVYIRNGSRFTRAQIHAACDASLKRLKTDYLDLYQLHWSDRAVNIFGVLGISTLNDPEFVENIENVKQALTELVNAGKIRYYGISNETPWGLMQHHLTGDLPCVSIQNPYNLLNRSFEVGLAEICLRENIGVMAYSPLAFGMLSGKYRLPREQWHADWRIAKYARFTRYTKPQAFTAVERYATIAAAANLTLTQLALAFVTQQKFVTTNIIGATTIKQLQENIATADIRLSDEIIKAINEVHAEISNPCP